MQYIPLKSSQPPSPALSLSSGERLSRAAPAGAVPRKFETIKAALGLKRLRSTFSSDLAIDLGTSNTLICKRDRQIILNEPSVLAVREYKGKKKVEAVGEAAKRMLGRTPENITAIRPLKDGVIADFRATEEMLQHFIRKIHHMRFLRPGPRVLICVPGKSTEVERRAIVESAVNSGARKVWLMEEPMAAAIGAGIEVEQASGSMVVDIGGGTTEIAIISLSGLVYCDSLRIGGDSFDEAIVNYVRRHRGSVIGCSTAERVKMQIGCASADCEMREITVPGRNLERGVPYSFPLNSGEVLKAMQDPLAAVVQAVRIALEQSPPELASDIAERGITVTGGGALLRGLDRLLMGETGLPVHIAEDPLTCVVRGGGMALEMDILRRLANSDDW